MENKHTWERIEKRFDDLCRHPEYTDVVTATRPEILLFLRTEIDLAVKRGEGEKMLCEWCKKPVDVDCQHYHEAHNTALSRAQEIIRELMK